MKKCPQCSRTYSDETLSFCLEDGTLLSPPFNPQETNAQTFVLNNAREIPPTEAAVPEIPTLVAQEIPTVVAERNIPAAAVSSPVTEKAAKPESVTPKIYLLGLVISFIVYIIFNYLLYPVYVSLTHPVYSEIADQFDSTAAGASIAAIILSFPFDLLKYVLPAFFLGYIWSAAKWKWGLIVMIPGYLFTIYYVLLYGRYETLLYFLLTIITIPLFTLVACLSASLGARLKTKAETRAKAAVSQF